jgi:integrase
MGRLSDLKVRNAKPRNRVYSIYDGDGLFLRVPPSGEKSWQLRYYGRKLKEDGELRRVELLHSVGKLKRYSLKEAREESTKLLKLALTLPVGQTLTEHFKDQQAQQAVEHAKRTAEKSNTFGVVAEAWVKRRAKALRWDADSHHAFQIRRSLGLDDDPARKLKRAPPVKPDEPNSWLIVRRLHAYPITEITAPLVRSVLREIESTRAYMADRIRARIHAVLNYAVWEGLIPGNPLPKAEGGEEPVVTDHYAAVTDLKGVGAILRKQRELEMEDDERREKGQRSQLCEGVRRAHVLLAFTAQRNGEVVNARWDEFALDGVEVPIGDGQYRRDPNAGNWTIPRGRMKQRKGKDKGRGAHVVPLPPDLLRQLRAWREADGKGAVYVCVAPRDPKAPIRIESVGKHHKDKLGLEGKHVPHGWRSTFSTICREAGKDGDVVEAQLDHKVGQGTVAAVYDRAERLELRRELMKWYEAELILARDGAKVLPLHAKSKT